MDEDLLIEVLCCLPSKILMQCCCVCKPWHALIYHYCVPRITLFLGCDIRIKTSSTDDKIGRAVIPESGEDVDVWPPMFNMAVWAMDSQVNLVLVRNICLTLKMVCFSSKIPSRRSMFCGIRTPNNLSSYHVQTTLGLSLLLRVKYINNSNCGLVDSTTYREHHRPVDKCVYGLYRRSVYLHGKMFILCYPHNLSWFEIRDNSVDVDFYSVDLLDRVHTKTKRTGCIGSCGGHIRYVQIDTALSSVQIWVINVDTRKPKWIEMYRVSLKVVLKHPVLVHLRTVLFPTMRRKLKLLALHPESDDGVIIWTPNLIFCYHLKSRNLVSLQCFNVLNAAIERTHIMALLLLDAWPV
ncbi:hypothetical protein V6N13_058071 [Hibiscus sabdariffa]